MSSYRLFKNNSRDFFDYTMDRVLKAVDEDERNKVDANFIAKIISGDSLGGDTTTPQQDVKYVNLNGKVAMTFKIRFVEKSSKYNFIEDPFSSDTPISEDSSFRQSICFFSVNSNTSIGLRSRANKSFSIDFKPSISAFIIFICHRTKLHI